MKSKFTSVVLFICLVFIWGTVAYKVYCHYSGDNTSVNVDLPIIFSSPKLKAKKVYNLSLNYPDPFLSSKRVSSKEVVKKPEVKAIVSWPSVVYNGCIYNRKGKLGILNLKGKTVFARRNKLISGVRVRKIYKDSILLEYSKERRIFKKIN